MDAERKHLQGEAGLNILAVEQTWNFEGELSDVTEARECAAVFLRGLACVKPQSSPEAHDDVLLAVTELASNAFTYAPGPFSLRLCAVADTVEIALTDTNPTAPKPRFADLTGCGGIGWHLINALAEQTITVPEEEGKTVHAFLPW
ncbi:ATP-binding protein [Streptomyces alboniger]|uniref:ATP-binding protein n=1 Tax=Streptomyces alboniger TaxID=132473 RepID=A0A5J6HAX0_STRAD|nr:ATP-binding protein [Streptomyces alboniger]QEV16442.1 ATP-binding protein [Streptomyces alboniger]